MNLNNLVLVFLFLLGLSFLLSILFIVFTNMLNRIQWWFLKRRFDKIFKNGSRNNLADSIIDLNLLKLKSEDIEKKMLAINSIMSMQNEWQDNPELKRKIISGFMRAIESESEYDAKIKILKLISEFID